MSSLKIKSIKNLQILWTANPIEFSDPTDENNFDSSNIDSLDTPKAVLASTSWWDKLWVLSKTPDRKRTISSELPTSSCLQCEFPDAT